MTRSILVVDDEPMLRRVMERFFRRLGYQTALAADGEEALALLEQHAFALVVCDVRMPRLDGLRTLEEAQRRFDDLPPWVFLTGYADRSERSLYDAGALRVLGKPTSIEEFRALLDDLRLDPAED